MKNAKLLAVLCVGAIALTGCGSAASGDKSLKKTESTQEQNETQETQDETQENASENTETDEKEQENTEEENDRVSLHIDGYDADNIPRLDGSLANEPLLMRMMQELTGVDAETAEVYLADSFENGGTSTSWGKLIYNSMDLIVSYEAPQEIKDMYETEMNDLEIEPLGRDGLVFIVNANNPVESLTVEQIRDIYTGEITDWSEVGGNPGKIKAFQRNSTSGSQTLLKKLVMNAREPMEPDKELLIGTMGELIEAVAGYDGSGDALGFSVYYYADKMKSDPNLKMIQVNGVTPSNESIEDNSYPLVNDFYVAIRASEEEGSPARELRDWLLSDSGKKLLEEEGYVWARGGN